MTPARSHRHRPTLSDAELKLIRAETIGRLNPEKSYTEDGREVTTLAALCALGLWGLSAYEISCIESGDITCGRSGTVRDDFRIYEGSRRMVEVSPPFSERWVIRRYLRWRFTCPHTRPTPPFANWFVGICSACWELGDWTAPLFLTRFRTPMRAATIRRRFAALRDGLKLNPRLTFGSLRRSAFERGIARVVRVKP